MHTATRVEAWVLEIMDRVRAGGHLEDARVELKAEWPAPERAARRLAGHANAARGEPVLWVVGVRQDGQLSAALSPVDLSSWWPRVQACFDGVAPDLLDVVVPYEQATLVALLFDTHRAPFVVRNSAFNSAGGPVELEVPWRDGTRTRSARREDLLRLLVPTVRIPDIELLDGELDVSDAQRPNQPAQLFWRATIKLYVSPASPGAGGHSLSPVHGDTSHRRFVRAADRIGRAGAPNRSSAGARDHLGIRRRARAERIVSAFKLEDFARPYRRLLRAFLDEPSAQEIHDRLVAGNAR